MSTNEKKLHTLTVETFEVSENRRASMVTTTDVITGREMAFTLTAALVSVLEEYGNELTPRDDYAIMNAVAGASGFTTSVESTTGDVTA